MKSRSARTSGKVLLSGEHAVVYGYPALAGRIDRGARVRVGKELAERVGDDNLNLLGVARGLFGERAGGLKMQVESNLPIGAGLGSSATVSAAAIKALSKYWGEELSKEKWFELTMQCERVAHGKPSGVDPAVVIYGGLVWFVKGKKTEKLKVVKRTKWFLVNTGRPVETTKEMVMLVEEKYERSKRKVGEIWKKIGELTTRIREELVEGGELKGLVDENGKYLEELGVVGERGVEMSRRLRKIGSGVKITGAGGVKEGSGMLLIYNPDEEKLRDRLEDQKIEYMEVQLG